MFISIINNLVDPVQDDLISVEAPLCSQQEGRALISVMRAGF